MERQRDITLEELCSIHSKLVWMAKDIVFSKEGVSSDRKNSCWLFVESFSCLVVSNNIEYKRALMTGLWDSIFKFVNEYIRDDGNLPRRRTAVEIYEQMKPIEEARIIKTEK